MVTPAASALDPLRFDRGADAVLARARQLIAAMVDSLPLLGDEPPGDGSIAERLWPRASLAAEAMLAEVAAGGSAGAVVGDRLRRGERIPGFNIDFALAALAHATGMVRGSGELVFAVARTTGWVAHALEQQASGTGYRPRAVYVGPRPAT